MKSLARPEDKVRILTGELKGERAVISKVQPSGLLLVRLVRNDQLLSVAGDELVNFSAAARLAWETMPKRRVGRPRSICNQRISVTLRIDKTLWKRVQALEESGRIKNRSAFIETLLEDALNNIGA